MTLPPILTTNLSLPAIAAPLFIISHPPLVLAQCRSGIIGSFPSLNARPRSQLDEWLDELTTSLTSADAPYAVNQIVHKSNDRLESDLELCVKYRVPIVITSLGAVEEVNDAVHSYGGIVLHDIINDRFARKAIDKGADGLIAVATGAGGHAGRLSPFALVSEIRRWFTGPLLLSGSIATGASLLAAQAMGADMGYIGSPFIATKEARASDEYKQAIVDSTADDIIYTDYFTGVHGNYLKSSITNSGLDPSALPTSDSRNMNFSTSATDAKAWKDIWGSGQGIGSITECVDVATLVATLSEQYESARRALLSD